MKKAFITGITGQDGSFLAELLLKKDYQVIGLVSKKYSIGNQNIESFKDKLVLESGDLLDEKSLEKILKKYKPDEVYNLGGITFIPQSWEKPELTFNVNALGALRLLKLIKDNCPKSKFYQATSAKIFGSPQESPQNEKTLVNPITPYAVSKAAAHFLTQNYRNHFDLFACSGIMYNHESERRGVDFVTRKITSTAAKISLGKGDKLVLGNLEAKQDWGYAPDYVEAMWLMLQYKRPSDYVVAAGKMFSVKNVCQVAFSFLSLDWKKYVEIDKKFIRKEEAKDFVGDYSKAKRALGWQPKTSFSQMIKKMVKNDLQLIREGHL